MYFDNLPASLPSIKAGKLRALAVAERMTQLGVVREAGSRAAHAELLERIGPACVIAHSQAGVFGLRLAHALRGRIRALVGLEPASVPSLDESGRCYAAPTLIVMGEHGNSHLLMMDANSLLIADHVDAWLGRMSD